MTTPVVWRFISSKYYVETIDHLRCIAANGSGYATSGSVPSYMTASYLQTEDIDCNGYTMIPIGDETTPFRGYYDGGNKKIKNWKNYESSTSTKQGIFGYTTNTASIIKNITITGDTRVKGADNIGILAGHFCGKISNINTNFDIGSIVSGTTECGGLVGLVSNSSTIEKIRMLGNLSITGTNTIGGVIGRANGSSAYYRDIIISTIGDIIGTNQIGGIIGSVTSSCTIGGLINEITGNITGTESVVDTSVGGIIGYNTSSEITRTINKMVGHLTGYTYVGGIVGSSAQAITNNINIMTGDIVSMTDTIHSGGIGFTSQASPTIQFNILAMNGYAPYILSGTEPNPSTNAKNNIYSNKFGMTGNNGSSSGTIYYYSTLCSYPLSYMTYATNIKYWDPRLIIPAWIYEYSDISTTSSSINSSATNLTVLPEVNWSKYDSTWYNVSTLNHLRCIASCGVGFNVTGTPPSNASNYMSAYYLQTANIDCNGYTMYQIGAISNIASLYFSGKYNGNNYEIRNWQNDQLSIDDNQGIFGTISNAILQNIIITGLVKVSGGVCGILCGHCFGTTNTISNILLDLSSGSVMNGMSRYGPVGGVLGDAYCSNLIIEKIKLTGYLTICGIKDLGGIVGLLNAGTNSNTTIRDVIYAPIGNIEKIGDSGWNIDYGGICGCINTGTINLYGCINAMTGSIIGNIYLGGILGFGASSTTVNIKACVNKMIGSIELPSNGTGYYAGGIFGSCSHCTIEDNMNIMTGNFTNLPSSSWPSTVCGIGYIETSTSINCNRNLVAMNGNIRTNYASGIVISTIPAGLIYSNNIFSNHFGLKFNGNTVTTDTINVGTYVTLDSNPTQLTTSSYFTEWDSVNHIPILIYGYTDTNGISREIRSDASTIYDGTTIKFDFTWQTGDSVYVNTNLKIGIGTNNPLKTLDINGDINLTGNLFYNYIPYGLWYKDNNNLIFNETGNIGIGKTNPEYKVDIDGTIRANTYYTISDVRLKNNIKNEILGLDYIKTLEPKTFSYISDKNKVLRHGFIAQDIRNPDFIEIDNKGFLSIKTESLIAPIIKSLQEISKRNYELKKKLNII